MDIFPNENTNYLAISHITYFFHVNYSVYVRREYSTIHRPGLKREHDTMHREKPEKLEKCMSHTYDMA